MSRDPIALLADCRDNGRLAVRRSLSEHTGTVLLCACIALTAALPLVVLRVVNPFSADFFLRTAYTLLTSTHAYILFIPEGRRCEVGRLSALSQAEAQLEALSRRVREGRLADFGDFCKRVAIRERDEARDALLARASLLPEGRAKGRLTRRAERMTPRTISPTLILVGAGRGALSDVGRRHLPSGTAGAILRPFLVLLGAILLSSVTVLPGAALDAATAVEILSGILGVTTAAFAGFSAGRTAARHTLAETERRVLFLTAFLEECPTPAS